MFTQKWSKIKSSLYSRCYAEACIEWRAHLRGLAPVTQLRRSGAAAASHWRHCIRFEGLGIRTHIYHTIAIFQQLRLSSGHIHNSL